MSDNISHRERLARAGNAKEGLVGYAIDDALRKLANGIWLVAGGLIIGV